MEPEDRPTAAVWIRLKLCYFQRFLCAQFRVCVCLGMYSFRFAESATSTHELQKKKYPPLCAPLPNRLVNILLHLCSSGMSLRWSAWIRSRAAAASDKKERATLDKLGWDSASNCCRVCVCGYRLRSEISDYHDLFFPLWFRCVQEKCDKRETFV